MPGRTISGLVKPRAAARNAYLEQPALTILSSSARPAQAPGRCGTAWLWPGTPLIAAPADARSRAASQPGTAADREVVSRVRGSGGTCRSGTETRWKDHGRATLPVWKGLVHAGATVYGLRGS